MSDFWAQVRFIASAVNAHKLVICLAIICGPALSILFGRLSTPQYSSYMTVTAVQSQSTSGLAAGLSASGLGSAAAALGIRGGGGQHFKDYLGLLQSDTIAHEFLKQPKEIDLLFPNRLLPDGSLKHGVLHPIKEMLFGLFGQRLNDRPTVGDVATALNKSLIITTDQTIATDANIRCVSSNPSICPRLLIIVHRLAEDRLRQIVISQSTERIQYLNRKIQQVSLLETKMALAQLLGSSERSIAIASGKQPIAAEIVQLPIVPQYPSFPKPMIMMLLGLLFGAASGVGVACLLKARAP